MKLTYHTHCYYYWKITEVLVLRGKGQQVLFFSSVFTKELSANAEIAECSSLFCMWDELSHLVLTETASSDCFSQIMKKQNEKQSNVHIFCILGQRLAISCKLFDLQKQFMKTVSTICFAHSWL